MSDIEGYLSGSIYHIVHFDNLQSILEQGVLFSKERLIQKRITHASIAYDSVQGLRDRVIIWSPFHKKYRNLHSYVPFYFASRTPMLYVQYKRNIQQYIVILEIRRSIMHNEGVIFTDGNASNQQLSVKGSEKVMITPATGTYSPCTRRYYPDGPFGTNPCCSEIYADVQFLDRLRWDIIGGKWFWSDEYKRIKHAEVLVPDSFPLSLVRNIAVSTREMAQKVDQLTARFRKRFPVPYAIYQPTLFFQ